MPFSIKDLGVLAYAHGFTFWFYRTEDDSESVASKNYFLDAADMLRVGDRITGSTADNRSVDLVVSKNDNSGVEIQVVAASPQHYR